MKEKQLVKKEKLGERRKEKVQKMSASCLNSSAGMFEKVGVNNIDIKVPKLLQIGEVCVHANSSSAEELMEF